MENQVEEEEEEDPVEFLQSMNQGDEGPEQDQDENPTTLCCEVAPGVIREPHYNPKKPLWWKKISGRPTKAQKRSIEAMMGFKLPRVEYGQFLDWTSVFPDADATKRKRDVWLEIGFGTGDNLMANAQKRPDICFVGAEVHSSGIGKICQRMHRAILHNQHWTGYTRFSEQLSNRPTTELLVQVEEVDMDIPIDTEAPLPSNNDSLYSNLRIYGGDGVKLLPYIADSSLSAILITFPDPFPQPKQASYRVIQKHTLMEFHRILRQGGRFFLATDHQGHYQWCHDKIHLVNGNDNDTTDSRKVVAESATVDDNKDDSRTAIPSKESTLLFEAIQVDRMEWLSVISKYEQKGWNEGRKTHLACWQVMKEMTTSNANFTS
jgi:tRNA G46 methylase TrmB